MKKLTKDVVQFRIIGIPMKRYIELKILAVKNKISLNELFLKIIEEYLKRNKNENL